MNHYNPYSREHLYKPYPKQSYFKRSVLPYLICVAFGASLVLAGFYSMRTV
jgi:hypothetical protein